MIQISNQDRDFIVRYIEEMNQNRRNETNRDYNLQRMANNIAKNSSGKKVRTESDCIAIIVLPLND